jgi:hypothetical protein
MLLRARVIRSRVGLEGLAGGDVGILGRRADGPLAAESLSRLGVLQINAV